MIEVFIEGLEFYGYHGVTAAEREIGHRYRVDLSMQVDSKAEIRDDVADSEDYGVIGKALTQFGETKQFKTLEKLAHEMAQLVLNTAPRVASLRITIYKVLPPAPFIAEACGVTLEANR